MAMQFKFFDFNNTKCYNFFIHILNQTKTIIFFNDPLFCLKQYFERLFFANSIDNKSIINLKNIQSSNIVKVHRHH